MLSHLILGFLRDGLARHGYELITEYKSAIGESGQRWELLPRAGPHGLERLVQTGVNPPEADARRIPYQITEKGRQSFDEWLISPSRDESDLSAWLLFIDRVPPETRDRLLDAGRTICGCGAKRCRALARMPCCFRRHVRMPCATTRSRHSFAPAQTGDGGPGIPQGVSHRADGLAGGTTARLARRRRRERSRTLGKGFASKMTDSIIRLTRVSKTYGAGEQAAIALDGIDLEVTRGEFVSLMGPSGSGKTTLLNIVRGPRCAG
jgi:DNA-binding PadR family transcriptional regulator